MKQSKTFEKRGRGGRGGDKRQINDSERFKQDVKIHLVFSLHDPLNSFRPH